MFMVMNDETILKNLNLQIVVEEAEQESWKLIEIYARHYKTPDKNKSFLSSVFPRVKTYKLWSNNNLDNLHSFKYSES